MSGRKAQKKPIKQVEETMAEEEKTPMTSFRPTQSNQRSAQERLEVFLRTRPKQIVVRQAKTMDEITVGLLFPNRDEGKVATD